jgi:hypothetical protein
VEKFIKKSNIKKQKLKWQIKIKLSRVMKEKGKLMGIELLY